jgi:hypothetical protein
MPLITQPGRHSVTLEGTTYELQPLAASTFSVRVAGEPVGRICYERGSASGISESQRVSEATLEQIAEAFRAAL